MQQLTPENQSHFLLSEDSCAKFFQIHDSGIGMKETFNQKQREILFNRVALREFLKANGYPQPDYLVAEKFEPLTAWAVKRNNFPLVLKSATNSANGQDMYILKAFRELPDFFESIRAENSSPIIIESLFPAKARIEVTFFNREPVLISQIGIEKSMRMLHSWRVFPIKPPTRCQQEVVRAGKIFAELLSTDDIPIRITFAVNTDRTVPLSINAGFNRLEYFEPWGNHLSEVNRATIKQETFSKLLFYRFTEAQIEMIDREELEKTLKATQKKIAVGSTTAILLSSENPSLLLEDSKKADSFFKHIHQDQPAPD